MYGEGTAAERGGLPLLWRRYEPPRTRVVEIRAPRVSRRAAHRPVRGKTRAVDQQRSGKVPVLAVVDLGLIGQRQPADVEVDGSFVADLADRKPTDRPAPDATGSSARR